MEEGRDGTVEKGVKELEEEITCAICHDHYADPKVLPCCHYYCKECLTSLVKRTVVDKPFSCPECRKETTLPQGGVDDLPAAFFVNRMKEVHSKLERAHGKVEAKCEMCSGNKAEAFCRHCMMFICAECVIQHEKLKVFAGHKTIPLDKLKEGEAKAMIMPEPSLKDCKTHEQPMNIFCFDCSCLICRDCTIKDHVGHDYEFIKVAAPKMKKKLTQQLDPLKEIRVKMSHAVEEIGATKSELLAHGDSMTGHIKSSFNELHKIIEDHEQKLLTEAGAKVKEKLENLACQEKSLSTACAVAQSVIEYTEQCVEHSADDEIMCMHAEIQSRIGSEIEEQRKEVKDLEPVEGVDIGVEVICAEDLVHLCQTKARITQLSIDPTQCAITGDGMRSAEVSNMSEFRVTYDGIPTKQAFVVECHLKTLANGSTTECEVNLIKNGEYRIQYTPSVRGRHELIVTVNGQEVAGSPFPVFVSIHPRKLGKPVRVIHDLKYPNGVTINSSGEIIVAEGDGDVVTLDKDGKRLRSIKRASHDLKAPRGVAVDEQDNVYFIDQKLNSIFKCDKWMRKVTRKEVGINEIPGHLWVTVIDDEVMVCEKANKGTIRVYNKELEHVRDIEPAFGTNAQRFTCLVADEHGKLYVSDVRNSCIQVITSDGTLLRSLGWTESGDKKLKNPFGLCIAGDYVFVSNWGYNNIAVFTRGGDYVSSFGQKGSKEGDFNTQCGVCIDEDGFLYVCDIKNNRLQIF